MQFKSELKHMILLISIMAMIFLFAFTLEESKINNITQIKISGNQFLTEDEYLKFSQLYNLEDTDEITMALIRDRLEKHPYVKNVDLLIVERGIAQIKIHEKKMDAVLFCNSKRFMITDRSEIIPLIPSTRNIDLPVIIDNNKLNKLKLFGNACNDDGLNCALKIISTAEVYDKVLYKNLSEINISDNNNLTLNLSELSCPIYFGKNNEIEKTVFLSKVFKHMKGNALVEYMNYVDLRYNELVYLGFDEKINKEEESI